MQCFMGISSSGSGAGPRDVHCRDGDGDWDGLGQAQFFAIEPPPGYVGTIASGLSGDGSTVVGGFITQVYNRVIRRHRHFAGP